MNTANVRFLSLLTLMSLGLSPLHGLSPDTYRGDAKTESWTTIERLAVNERIPEMELPRGRILAVSADTKADASVTPTVAAVGVADAKPAAVTGAVNITPGVAIVVEGKDFGVKDVAAPLIYGPIDEKDPAKTSDLGVMKKWSGVENFKVKAVDGQPTLVGDTGKTAWTLRLNREMKPGEVLFVSYQLNRNFDVTKAETNNLKVFRAWSKPGEKPNVYDAMHNGRVYVEGVTGSGLSYGKGGTEKGNRWETVQIEFRPSDVGEKNGFYKRFSDGNIVDAKMEKTMFVTQAKGSKDSDATLKVLYPVHQVIANPSRFVPKWDKATNTVMVRNVYVDILTPKTGDKFRSPSETTVPRIVVTDAKEVSKSKRFDVLPTTAWKDGSVTVKANLPQFKAGDTAYMHIVNEHNRWSDPIELKIGR